MKPIILFLVTVSSVVAFCADCKDEAKVAVTFLNQYVAFRDAAIKTKQSADVEKWLKSNTLITKEFIANYKSEERKGLAMDPELGWDSDVILNSQDYPDQGFKFLKCLDQNGFVVLQGVDWPEFTVTVCVVTTKNGFKVSGSGVVNIPKQLQAKQ